MKTLERFVLISSVFLAAPTLAQQQAAPDAETAPSEQVKTSEEFDLDAWLEERTANDQAELDRLKAQARSLEADAVAVTAELERKTAETAEAEAELARANERLEAEKAETARLAELAEAARAESEAITKIANGLGVNTARSPETETPEN